MKHLLTMTTDGTISDASGEVVARLSDTSYIGDFLLGFRAGHGPVEGEIIRDGDYQAWEAACVARENARKTPQVPAKGEAMPRTAWDQVV